MKMVEEEGRAYLDAVETLTLEPQLDQRTFAQTRL